MKFSILITTKDRLEDLKYTLQRLSSLMDRDDLECIICDDGSSDSTFQFIEENYPNIQLIRNEKSQGLIYSRNRLLSLVKTEFAISLDDDLHFITENPLEIIEKYFREHQECGLISFRIFWSKLAPTSTDTKQKSGRVKSFAGCAHVWRMDYWREIPDYPEWFIFYGEEDFASYHLLKKNREIHYVPEILTHHRVDIKGRKKNSDYTVRLRRSLRSGWYLYFLFFPIGLIPRRLSYSLYMQFKLKVFKGDIKALRAIFLALTDLILNFPRIIKNANRLTADEFIYYGHLSDTKLYWKPEDEK